MEAYIVYPSQEQEQLIIDFLESLNVPFEKRESLKLPDHVLAGIRRGQEDVKLGRTLNFDDFKKNLIAKL